MPGLAEIQFLIRQAAVEGDMGPAEPLLSEGSRNAERLNVHRRNYEASLVAALRSKFPAACWLVGEEFVMEAARHFVQEFPPGQPCIAEYGAQFPVFLAASPLAAGVPYLRDFAELEWRVGLVSIAADEPAIGRDEMRSVSSDAALKFQSGIHYLKTSWPVDDLLSLYVTDLAPDRLEFAALQLCLEIRGSRGEFRIHRLNEAQFAFRSSLAGGFSTAEAAENASVFDGGFDPAAEIAELVAGQFLLAVVAPDEGEDQ